MNTLLTIIIIAAILVGLCFAGLAITIIVKKNGKFPETGIGHNKNMRKLGIRCAKQEEIIRWRKENGQQSLPSDFCSGCDESCE
jgi:hypothetical protein